MQDLTEVQYDIINTYKGDKKAEYHGEQEKLGMAGQEVTVYPVTHWGNNCIGIMVVPPMPLDDLLQLRDSITDFTEVKSWGCLKNNFETTVYHREQKYSKEELEIIGSHAVHKLITLGYNPSLGDGATAPMERGLYETA